MGIAGSSSVGLTRAVPPWPKWALRTRAASAASRRNTFCSSDRPTERTNPLDGRSAAACAEHGWLFRLEISATARIVLATIVGGIPLRMRPPRHRSWPVILEPDRFAWDRIRLWIVSVAFSVANPATLFKQQRSPACAQRMPGTFSRVARATDFRSLRSLQSGLRHRSGEHTSELQSHTDLVCRLLLEK